MKIYTVRTYAKIWKFIFFQFIYLFFFCLNLEAISVNFKLVAVTLIWCLLVRLNLQVFPSNYMSIFQCKSVDSFSHIWLTLSGQRNLSSHLFVLTYKCDTSNVNSRCPDVAHVIVSSLWHHTKTVISQLFDVVWENVKPFE